ncbi:MAG TPA: hypothetical protein VGH19_06865 [Verrucomicrobiae bacterium]
MNNKKLIHIPEFAFTTASFNLGIGTTADGERISRELEMQKADKAAADQAQARLPLPPTNLTSN